MTASTGLGATKAHMSDRVHLNDRDAIRRWPLGRSGTRQEPKLRARSTRAGFERTVGPG